MNIKPVLRNANKFAHLSARYLSSVINSKHDMYDVSLSKALTSAEKLVGYPTSFMNLRFWLSDEMSNVAVNMRKLIGTRHPLMKTAKGLLFDNQDNMQTRGLVVLLVSKVGGEPCHPVRLEHHPLEIKEMDNPQNDSTSQHRNGILITQRSLAEITEMIHTAFVLHKGVMDIDINAPNSDTDDLLYGNKMALLSGDYLLAKASTGLATLENTYVVELMASAIADLMEARFYLDDVENTLKGATNLTLQQWEELAYRSGSCLYAKSCQSALMLSHHPEEVTKQAYIFGKYFGYLKQMKYDITASDSEVLPDSILNVVSDDIVNVKNITERHKTDLQLIAENYLEKAKSSLEIFQNSDARQALVNVITALAMKKM